MKKKNYTLFSLLMVIVMAFTINLTVFAASSENTDETLPDVSSDFIEVCNQLFSGNGEVYDANEINITNSFIEKYNSTYQEEDYITILAACYEEKISRICVHERSESQNSARSVLNLTYKESSIHFMEQTGSVYNGKTWYIIITASGSYGYQDSNGTIISFPSPTISYQFSGLGALFSGNVTSTKTTTPTINTSKTAATFKTTVTHVVNCPLPGLDGEVSSVTTQIGPFTTVSSFTIEAP